jgi:hypothetical protein
VYCACLAGPLTALESAPPSSPIAHPRLTVMGERCRYRASWGESALSCTCHLKVSLFSNAVPALPTHQKSRNLHSCAWPLACCTVHSTREARATARGAPATCICDLWPPLSCSSRQERRAGRLRRGRSSPSPPARRQHPHGAFLYHPRGVADRCQLLRLRASLKRGASCL